MNKFKINVKKMISFALCVLILISSILPNISYAWVSEEGTKCSSRVGNYYKSKDGDYYYFPDHYQVLKYDKEGDTTIEKYAGGGEKRHEYILIDGSGNEKQVFCLEAGVQFEGSTNGYKSENGNNSSYFQNLPYTARYGIMLASMYSNETSVPSAIKDECNMDDFRFAAQCIIWEYQQQLRTSPTSRKDNSTIDKDTYYQGIKGRPAEVAYNWILKQMSNHTTIPSFSSTSKSSAKTYTLKYSSETEKFSLTLTDSNNTLADLTFDNSNGITVKRNGNEYTFTSDEMIENTVTITAHKKLNKNYDKMLLWGRVGYQTMISGAEDPVQFYVKIDTEHLGDLELRKLNENEDLVDGAVFNVRGPNGYDKDITVSNGKIKVEKLKIGTYYITEKSVPEGYLLNTNTYEVEIEIGQTTKQAIINQEPTGELNVVKTDIETGNKDRVDKKSHHGDATLKGAVYTLYASNDIYNKAGTVKYFSRDEVIATFTFNEYGVPSIRIISNSSPSKINIKGNILAGLPMGNYYLKETIVPTGYTQDTNTYDVTFSYRDSVTKIIKVSETVNNKVQKAPFEVIKVTTNDNTIAEYVENAEFTAILKKYVDYYGSFEEAKKHLDEYANDEYSIFRTGSNGHGVSGLLAYGEYVVNETYTPSDRIETVEEFYVTLHQDSKTPIKEMVANDLPFEAYIKMQKKDKKTNKFVTFSNATFELYKLNEDTDKWEKVKCKVGNQYFESWTTDNEGIARTETKLEAGIYKLEEINIPTGFLQLDEELRFEVNNRNATLNYDDDLDAWITVDVLNEQPTGSLTLNKSVVLRENVDTSLVDISDLSGIKFRLTAKEDIIDYADGSIIYKEGEQVGEYNLDGKGKLKVSNLPMGKYELEEIETLPGLVLDNTKHEIVFEQQDTTTKVYTINKKIENNTTAVEFSKTDITGDKEIVGAELSVYDTKGNLIDNWISNEKAHVIEGLEVNKDYILREENSPDTYVKASDISFTVNNDKEIQKVKMIDKQVEILKTDVDGNAIEGVTLIITNTKTKNIVDKWTTEKTAHKVSGLVEGEKYILHEQKVIGNYVESKDIEFTVSFEKETQNVTMIDKLLLVSKVDSLTGEEIEGAELTVTDKEGKVIDKWISSGESHQVKGLKEGEEYILTEINSPYGYKQAESIKFVVSEEKENQIVEMKDMPILKTIKVIKADSQTNEIIKSKFTFGIYTDEKCTNLIKEIKSDKENGTVTFEDLRYGTYYIKEVKAPKGYQLSDKVVKIEINDKGTFKDGELLEDNDSVCTFVYYNNLIPKVQTGNETNYLLLIGSIVISLLGIGTGLYILKKKKNN